MIKDIFSLQGKNIILTGGLGLLGQTFALHLLNYGAKLIVLDTLDASKAIKQLQAVFTEFGNNVFYYQVDITKEIKLEAIKKKILKEFGKIDVLINNAGLNPLVLKKKISNNTFENSDINMWQKMIDVNLTGTMLCCKIFGSTLKKGGSIINIASLYGVQAPDQRIYDAGFTKPASYTATKGAVIALTKYLAAYWGKKGIRVNAISPGGVEDRQSKSFIKKYSHKTPLNRMCRASELAGALIYFCSDSSSYTTGTNLIVDGGWSIW
jgi:NAD(P)-dependent dehydrogenase (short-subunit alcohol dehydrogenase family)